MLKKILAIAFFSVLFISYLVVMRHSNDFARLDVSKQSAIFTSPEYMRQVAASGTSSAPSHSALLNAGMPENSATKNVTSEPALTINTAAAPNATKKSEEFSRYSRSLDEKGLSLQDDLSEKFKNESVDHEWAPFYEEKIRSFFADTIAINNFVPDAVICKTQKCRIQLHAANDQELAEAAQLFTSTFQADGGAIPSSDVIVVPDFSAKVIFLYIGKDKDSPIYQ
jgi:hypothetical protein